MKRERPPMQRVREAAHGTYMRATACSDDCLLGCAEKRAEIRARRRAARLERTLFADKERTEQQLEVTPDMLLTAPSALKRLKNEYYADYEEIKGLANG